MTAPGSPRRRSRPDQRDDPRAAGRFGRRPGCAAAPAVRARIGLGPGFDDRPGRLALCWLVALGLAAGLAAVGRRRARRSRSGIGRPLQAGERQPGECSHLVSAVVGARESVGPRSGTSPGGGLVRLRRTAPQAGPCPSGSAGRRPGVLLRATCPDVDHRQAGRAGARSVQRLPVSSPQVTQQCGSCQPQRLEDRTHGVHDPGADPISTGSPARQPLRRIRRSSTALARAPGRLRRTQGRPGPWPTAEATTRDCRRERRIALREGVLVHIDRRFCSSACS